VLVYLCNPNNPTGTLTRCDEIDAWIGSVGEDVSFLIDEAYFEYAVTHPDYRTSLPWIESHPNVMVVRTFSKIYGMAGMRLGYGMAHPSTAAKLHALAGKNNANFLACTAALASLEDPDLVQRGIASNDQARDVLCATLDDLAVEYLETHTNFLMHRIRTDLDTYRKQMLEAGFAVGRPFPPMLTYNRVSLGLPDEMEQFCSVLRRFRERGWV
jgi:histidinol-phosphate aminotransferase